VKKTEADLREESIMIVITAASQLVNDICARVEPNSVIALQLQKIKNSMEMISTSISSSPKEE